MQMAEGYPIEAQTANRIEAEKELIKTWPYSKKVFFPHLGEKREAPNAGEIFVQTDLLETLKKLVQTEQEALKKERIEKKQSMQPTIDSTKAILLKNLHEVVRNKAVWLLKKTWRTGK